MSEADKVPAFSGYLRQFLLFLGPNAQGAITLPNYPFAFRVVSCWVTGTPGAANNATLVMTVTSDGQTVGQWMTPQRIGAAGIPANACLATMGHNTQARISGAPNVDVDVGTIPPELWITSDLTVTFRYSGTTGVPTAMSNFGLILQRELST